MREKQRETGRAREEREIQRDRANQRDTNGESEGETEGDRKSARRERYRETERIREIQTERCQIGRSLPREYKGASWAFDHQSILIKVHLMGRATIM